MSVISPLAITFMGSPDFAIPALRALCDAGHNVSLVVTQPDRPAGRGKKQGIQPVKVEATKLKIPVFQPESFKNLKNMERLIEASPDLIVVAAYGIILPVQVLKIPTLDTINIHPSLLPRWRGPSPIQSAILEGDNITGVSIISLNEHMDAGPILMQKEVLIGAEETAGQLSDRLAEAGAAALLECVDTMQKGDISSRQQNIKEATFCKLISKEMGELNRGMTLAQAERSVRAYSPWPGAFVNYRGSKLAIWRAHGVPIEMKVPYGTFLKYDDSPAINLPGGILVIDELQKSGRSRIKGSDFLNGERGVLQKIDFVK